MKRKKQEHMGIWLKQVSVFFYCFFTGGTVTKSKKLVNRAKKIILGEGVRGPHGKISHFFPFFFFNFESVPKNIVEGSLDMVPA